MIITGDRNTLIILNDTDLSTIKHINNKGLYLSSGIYHKERDIIYLGTEMKILIEFDFKKLEVARRTSCSSHVY